MGINGSQISKMDRRIEVVEFTEVIGTLNEKSRSQVSIKEVWAELMFKSSSEDNQEKVYEINKRDYIIHYDPDIAAKDIQDLAVVDDGKVYYVIGYSEWGRQMFIQLNCEYRG